jgi:GDP/UDP-N,N'-diacetylbacillosamine 2-epimerase (hydrolysing)
VLGDRGEMLAAALAAVHLNIPVVHIHGGERSGTIDESIRHAISKLAHFHFVATCGAKERLIGMGEQPNHIHITGAPGLDGIETLVVKNREQLLSEIGFSPERPVALMIYHPVTQEAELASDGAFNILKALKKRQIQTIAIKPNSDAGSDGIRELLESQSAADLHVLTHFPRASFVSWMAAVNMMIGNSSAGIIEAASFGTPVINVGTRQNLRERNCNVIDVGTDAPGILGAIDQALERGRMAPKNIYGDGRATPRIVSLLDSLVLDPKILLKSNAY